MSHRCCSLRSLVICAVAFATPARDLAAVECHLEKADGLPAELAPAISKELNAAHIKLRLDSDDFCELWLAKTWKCRVEAAGASSPASVSLPMEAGSLVGAIRLAHACYDLRDQEIPAGVYTLRYAIQPDIEAHKDSHECRDFVLLVAASSDKSLERIADQDKVIAMSADSIVSTHPAFLPLLPVAKPGNGPSVRRDPRDSSGWLLQVHGKDDAGKTMSIEFILLHAKTGG